MCTMARSWKLVLPLLVLALGVVASAAAPAQEKAAENKDEVCLGTNPDAPILIEVYSDPQCPACRRFYLEVARPLLADYAMKGKVCVVYHEFPLAIHQYGRAAARYAEAAGRLGNENWIKVADALYYYQGEWAANGQIEPVLARALSEKEMAQLEKDAKDPKIEAELDHNLAEGRQRGVRATPTVFLTNNGRTETIPPGVQYTILRRYLDSLLGR